MGPQLYRCGNLGSRLLRPHPAGSFNGAATLSLRKRRRNAFGRITTVSLLQWGRNFIVAEIPTCVGLGRSVGGVLQWGRNFIVAEIRHRQVPISLPIWLQWGRNFIVAEIRKIASPPPLTFSLQWGRNFIVAEIRLTAPTVWWPCKSSFNGAATLSLRKLRQGKEIQHGHSCFNGAATLSLRKSGLFFHRSMIALMLQLYRCGPHTFIGCQASELFVAEIRRLSMSRRAVQVASMGPQLYRCGNPGFSSIAQ